MDEDAVKETFRAWIEQPDCPWYVKEQWETENNRKLRGVGKTSRRKQGVDGAMSQQAYREKLDQLVAAADYAGAADLKAAYEKQEEKSHKRAADEEEHDDKEKEEDADGEGEDEEEEEKEVASDTEESSAEETNANEETRVLKMLYRGNMEELNKGEEQVRKAKVFNRPATITTSRRAARARRRKSRARCRLAS